MFLKNKENFVPKSKLAKHKEYLKAFSDESSIEKHFKYINKFLVDPAINSNKSEDIEIFRNFICDKFGMLNITYSSFIVNKMTEDNYNWSINILSKYIEYAGKTLSAYRADIFEYLLRDVKNKKILESLIKKLSRDDRLAFLEQAAHHASIIEMLPKIKLYLLFS
jgi:hypothetical protein